MRALFLGLTVLFLFLGCAPKAVDMASLNPALHPSSEQIIAVYNQEQDTILFYEFTFKNNVLVERTWGKVIPFRVEFMDLWVTGLGHDIRRLTNLHAEEIRPALMYAAEQNGMQTLHVNQKDYIIDNEFARSLITAIDRYEEKIKRYERDRDFPFLLRR